MILESKIMQKTLLQKIATLNLSLTKDLNNNNNKIIKAWVEKAKLI